MELKLYLRILLRKWWIIVPAFLVTFASAIVFTFAQAPTYRTTATFVIAPASSDAKSLVNDLSVLSSRAQIASTYAEVAASSSLKRKAAAALNLSASQKQSLSVESQVRAGTNVIEIKVEGSNPALVRDFANKVGDEAVAYVANLYEVYTLKTLDEAPTPVAPVKPDKKLNLALGAVLGLVLGGGLAMLAEYLQAPLEEIFQAVRIYWVGRVSGGHQGHKGQKSRQALNLKNETCLEYIFFWRHLQYALIGFFFAEAFYLIISR